MKEKKRGTRIEIWVGGFVLVGILALFVAILLIGRERHFFEKTYQIKTAFSKIAGLRMGAPVKLGGIDVGNVKNVFFDEQGKVEVILEIRYRFNKQIRHNSLARISTMGLMGDKIIEITVGTSAAKALLPGETLNSEDPLDVSDIIEIVKPSLKDLERTLKNLADFTDRLGSSGGQLDQTLNNLRSITQELKSGEGVLPHLLRDKQTYEDLRTLTSSGAKAAQKLETVADRAEKASKDLEPIMADLQISMKNLKAASQELPGIMHSGKEAVDNVNKTMKSLQGNWLLGSGASKAEKTPAMGRAPARVNLYEPIILGPKPQEGGK